MVPPALRLIVTGSGIVLGGILALNVVSNVAIGTLRLIDYKKRAKFAMDCGVCKGRGIYLCKLCKGNSTINWSPLYDPVGNTSPCLCPTCDGQRVQRCLNCLGRGFVM